MVHSLQFSASFRLLLVQCYITHVSAVFTILVLITSSAYVGKGFKDCLYFSNLLCTNMASLILYISILAHAGVLFLGVYSSVTCYLMYELSVFEYGIKRI